jgi:hypothetical protein
MSFMRRRPLLRKAAVAGGAYLAGKHRAGRQADQEQRGAEQDQSSDEQRQPAAAPQPPASPTMADQVNQLADQHKQGVLNDAEFAAAKRKLLGT